MTREELTKEEEDIEKETCESRQLEKLFRQKENQSSLSRKSGESKSQ